MAPTRGNALLLAACLLASTTGCGFAVKHPAITAGILGGTVGLGSCELAGADHSSCFLIGGGAAAVLGGVVALALLVGGEGNTILREDPADEQLRPEPPTIEDQEPVPAPAPTEGSAAAPAPTTTPAAEPASAPASTTPPPAQ